MYSPRIKSFIKRAFIKTVRRFELMRTTNLVLKLAYWLKFSMWCAKHPSPKINDANDPEYNYRKRHGFYEAIVESEGLQNESINYLEFGVYQGNSLKWWVGRIPDLSSRFVGFDTFSGLPEAWSEIPQGTFTTQGRLPDIKDPRCSFEVGLFQDTLPEFLQTFRAEQKTVVHLDADLYSSTLFVLTTIGNRLKKGDLLLFDDFASPLHEFRAFDSFVDSFYVQYELIGAMNNHRQICIKLT